MLAEVSPTSLLYYFLERGDEFVEASFSNKPLTGIVLLPEEKASSDTNLSSSSSCCFSFPFFLCCLETG